MRAWIAVLLVLAGAVAVVAGVVLLAGVAWGLIVGGVAAVAAGFLADVSEDAP